MKKIGIGGSKVLKKIEMGACRSLPNLTHDESILGFVMKKLVDLGKNKLSCLIN